MLFMERAIESMQTGKYALLESPTGTGKTLALLCAALAWQKSKVDNMQSIVATSASVSASADSDGIAMRQSMQFGPMSGMTMGEIALGQMRNHQQQQQQSQPTVPLIIYASRTHSQLVQVVQELKATSYRPLISALGSRQTACVHPQVENLNDFEQKSTCKQLLKSRSCSYRDGVDRKVSEILSDNRPPPIVNDSSSMSSPNPISFSTQSQAFQHDQMLDIEELYTLGKAQRFCPYFLSRDEKLLENADIVFMPYNYLLDPATRKGLEIRWQGAVVIIDEAHNIESACDEASSFSLSTSVIYGAIAEIDECVRRVIQIAPSQLQKVDPLARPKLFEVTDQTMPSESDLVGLKRILAKLIDEINKIPLAAPSSSGSSSSSFGDDTYGPSKFATLPGTYAFDILGRCGITAVTKDAVNQFIERATEFHMKSKYMSFISTCISRVFDKPDSYAQTKSYFKVYVEETRRGNQHASSKLVLSPTPERIFHFWCFSPCVALDELRMLGIHDIILASGTLSPLGSFAAQLRVPFPVKYEGSHVIDNQTQLYLTVLGKGVTGKQLNSSYHNRNDADYQNELGNSIANFVRIIPGGILVFFPSYGVMDACITQWKKQQGSSSSIWDRISEKKRTFIESHTAQQMKDIVDEYCKAVDSPGGGAIFFAVCRGKASEGIDFKDARCRAVVITGLPFPPKNDPRVVLKRNFLDEITASKPMQSAKLSGAEWYSQQAIRAVNQAVGRVIRHKDDFGAVILCDERFSSQSSQLSHWLRSSFRVASSFGEANRSLALFFKRAMEKFIIVPQPNNNEDSHSSVASSTSISIPVQQSFITNALTSSSSSLLSSSLQASKGNEKPKIEISYSTISTSKTSATSAQAINPIKDIQRRYLNSMHSATENERNPSKKQKIDAVDVIDEEAELEKPVENAIKRPTEHERAVSMEKKEINKIVSRDFASEWMNSNQVSEFSDILSSSSSLSKGNPSFSSSSSMTATKTHTSEKAKADEKKFVVLCKKSLTFEVYSQFKAYLKEIHSLTTKKDPAITPDQQRINELIQEFIKIFSGSEAKEQLRTLFADFLPRPVREMYKKDIEKSKIE